MPEDMTFDGEMPEGGMFDGEMPDRMTFDGEMPEGGMFSGGMPEGGENETLPSDEGESETAWAETDQAGESETEENMGSDGEEPEEGQGGRLRGGEQSFAEAQTVYLPVNVVVHTSSDTEATFMILEAGDELEVLLEENESGEEVITEIWMS